MLTLTAIKFEFYLTKKRISLLGRVSSKYTFTSTATKNLLSSGVVINRQPQ